MWNINKNISHIFIFNFLHFQYNRRSFSFFTSHVTSYHSHSLTHHFYFNMMRCYVISHLYEHICMEYVYTFSCWYKDDCCLLENEDEENAFFFTYDVLKKIEEEEIYPFRFVFCSAIWWGTIEKVRGWVRALRGNKSIVYLIQNWILCLKDICFEKSLYGTCIFTITAGNRNRGWMSVCVFVPVVSLSGDMENIKLTMS